MSDSCQSTVETDSFLLGRLQLWLQYICSRVPNAQVLIVGTHADHPSVTRDVLENIWGKIRGLLASERDKHQRYFGDRETLKDCLLCQSDTKTFNADQWTGTTEQVRRNGVVNRGYESQREEEEEEHVTTSIAFPHIVGYYKVCSVRGSTGGQSPVTSSPNPGVEGLREAIRELALRVIRTSPEVPRRWSDVRESLQSHVTRNPEASLLPVDEVSRFAHAHGVEDPKEITNMLQFFRAQGSLLYFPRLCDLQEIVVLDPEWLAGIFATSRSSRISESGWIDRDQLKLSWADVTPQTRDRVLILLRYFGLCFPIDGTSLELFPSRIPYGDPDPTVWPSRPRSNQRHVTYSMTFPTSIPPPFFNSLMSAVYSYRAPPDDDDDGGLRGQTGGTRPLYFANIFLETLRPDSVGCGVCQTKRTDGTVEEVEDLLHQVLFQMIPHRRTIQVSARGTLPCCMMKKVTKIMSKVINSYEGLKDLTFDSIVCPICVFENRFLPQRLTWKALSSTGPPSCRYGHTLPDSKSILSGSFPTPEPPSPPEPPHSNYTGCPKLFVLLPVSHVGTAIGPRDPQRLLFASSLVFDGYAVHFACESPDAYHVIYSSLGYRLSNPREFLKLYGTRAMAVFRLLVRTQTSSSRSTSGSGDWTIDDLVRDLQDKFPVFKDTSANMKTDTLKKYVDEDVSKVRREDLKRLLRLVDQPSRFGPLRRSTTDQGQTIWLCHDHWCQMDQLDSRSNEEILLKDKRSQNNDRNNNY